MARADACAGMKFRLPPETFPELDLAKEDMDNMDNVAAMIVDSAIEDFENLRLDYNGLADKRWKPIKRKAGVMLYEDRSMRENLKRESSLSDVAPSPSGIHPLMAIGTTRGELNELMFGLLNPTREEMLAKSACTGTTSRTAPSWRPSFPRRRATRSDRCRSSGRS